MKIGVSKGQRVCKEKEQLDQLLSVKVERLLGIWNKQKMGKKKSKETKQPSMYQLRS